MPTKTDLLNRIRSAATNRIVTKEEVNAAYDAGFNQGYVPSKKINFIDVLYYVGGGIIFLGLFILADQKWEGLSFSAKVVATLGFGIVAYILAYFFDRKATTKKLASPFYFISALAIPVGGNCPIDSAAVATSPNPAQTHKSEHRSRWCPGKDW